MNKNALKTHRQVSQLLITRTDGSYTVNDISTFNMNVRNKNDTMLQHNKYKSQHRHGT